MFWFDFSHVFSLENPGNHQPAHYKKQDTNQSLNAYNGRFFNQLFSNEGADKGKYNSYD